MVQYVYSFMQGFADGNSDLTELLGRKGANLAEMAGIGLPVPPGFTLTTEVCKEFFERPDDYSAEVYAQVNSALKNLQQQMGKRFGDSNNPLFLAIRASGRRSMPGTIATILNIGLNEQTVKGLYDQSGDAYFAYDSYRRFIQTYAELVMGMDSQLLAKILADKKRAHGVSSDNQLSALDLRQLIVEFKECYRENIGSDFPEDPMQQLWGAVSAVFASWKSERAVSYRRLHNIPSHWGTAINVQAMVFGNMGRDCVSGVACTRDPATGENYFFGEYLVNGQLEDLLYGERMPQPLNRIKCQHQEVLALDEFLPGCYNELIYVRTILETHFCDIQDIQFIIQSGKLYILQTRAAKRTPYAAVRVAVEMVEQQLLTEQQAVFKVQPEQLQQLLHPVLDSATETSVIAHGVPASPGLITGKVVFTEQQALLSRELNENVILVRQQTCREDLEAITAAQGILTLRSGVTSHAALIAREMGKCCIIGCTDLRIEQQQLHCQSGDIINQGDIITINGYTGEIILGGVATVAAKLSDDLATLLGWADKFSRLNVRCNTEVPLDATLARQFGAQGIGLCRTEHMFWGTERLQAVREMILAVEPQERQHALTKLTLFQKQDFIGLFSEMKGLPVSIRLLDQSLAALLPQSNNDIAMFAKAGKMQFSALKAQIDALHEQNPILGHRGCRLGISYPEIYDMQVTAIMQAACELIQQQGYQIIPEIMIPLVSDVHELQVLRKNAIRTAEQVLVSYGLKVDYQIGTMIELPRAAIMAEQIAQQADFFSFGSNDLTETCYGMSRVDCGHFLPEYLRTRVFSSDPFVTLDDDGVGQLMKIAIVGARRYRTDLPFGICGDHGGDPASIAFCHNIGLDYVSCSPYRVPIARLAAAHVALIAQDLL